MKIFVSIAAMAMSLGVALTAAAQQGPGGMRAACAADIQQFCAGAQGPDRRRCMTENQDKLSEGCRTAMQTTAAEGKARREACAGDVQTLCATAGPGAGKKQCLRANEDKLSEGCKAAMGGPANGAEGPGQGHSGSE